MPSQTTTVLQNIFPTLLSEANTALFKTPLFPVMLDIHIIDRLVNVEDVKLSTWLSEEEIDKYQTYALPKRKLEYLTGRISAKMSIASFLEKNSKLNIHPAPSEIRISNLESGRPTFLFENPKLLSHPEDISISHSNQYACAVSSKKFCGVDIQSCNATLARVKDKFCSPAEERYLNSMFNSLGSLPILSLLWSAKEAVKKNLSIIKMPGFLEIHLKDITIHKENVYKMNFSISENDMLPCKVSVIATIFDDYAIALSSFNQ